MAIAAPTLDTGFTAVPTSLTSVSAVTSLYLYGAHFCNTSSAAITLTLTDTAENKILDTKEVPAQDIYTEDWALLPTVGLKWSASDAGLTGKIWGYLAWPL